MAVLSLPEATAPFPQASEFVPVAVAPPLADAALLPPLIPFRSQVSPATAGVATANAAMPIPLSMTILIVE